ncbi:hypothetical protein FSJ48_011880 [Escherichia coli]|nr:hypothetical protein [Escherichia coli]
MSNTLNHTSSRQIVRHYTHRQKRRKHLMQYFVSANGLFELKVKVYAFLFDVILQGNCRSSIGIKTPKRVKKHHKTDVSSTPLLLHMNGTDD